MAVPWLRLLDTVLRVTDFAFLRRLERRGDQEEREGLESGRRGLGHLETRLTGVVVAALKEAFDRDTRRLDLERERLEVERLRAARALRLELLSRAGDREIGRLRLMASVAVAGWVGTLFFSTQLIGRSAGARVAVGAGWALLLAAAATAFLGQSTVARRLARMDLDRGDREVFEPTVASLVAPWLIVVGLALVGLAALV